MSRILSIAAVAFGALAFSAVQAAPVTYYALLSGQAEATANNSPGMGEAFVTLDVIAHTLSLYANFSGLRGTTIAAHIHCCTATPGVGTSGVATETPYFNGFPLGVQAGIYDHLFDLTQASSWNPGFVTANAGIAGAEMAFANGMAAGKSYLNIHTTAFPGGEIRGFLIPEPTSAALSLLALAALGGLRVSRSKLRCAPERSGPPAV